MKIAAKVLEAVGISCVMIGLIQGIMSETLWMELYLSITGIVVFLIGWGMEKFMGRKQQATAKD